MAKDSKIQIDLDAATIDGVDAQADAVGDSREAMIVRLVKIGLGVVPGDDTRLLREPRSYGQLLCD